MNRLILTLLLLALPVLILARWQATPIQTISKDYVALPDRIGEWRGGEYATFEEKVLAMIRPDSYLMRRYDAPGRTPLSVYVALYAGRAGHAFEAHDPRVCFPARGWEIVENESEQLRVTGSKGPIVTSLDAHHGADREKVLFWFQPANRWPHSTVGEEFLRILDALSGSPQYAFVRISAKSSGLGRAERDVQEFAQLVARHVRSAVEGVEEWDVPTSAKKSIRVSSISDPTVL